MTRFLHDLPDAKQLFEVVAKEKEILPIIVEKDYWLMHCLWGLQQQNFKFELKGGTSLSKGFNIIERFSEDIDIQIYPDPQLDIKIGRNHDRPTHIQQRSDFFNYITKKLNISNMKFYRDHNFDDVQKMRSAGIRGEYDSFFSNVPSLKSGVILELGFDQTTPNMPCDISSWAFDKIMTLDIQIIDNRAKKVNCYNPEYTFVEKLQTISTKFRIQQKNHTMPINFLRHYYDIYQLLNQKRILDFIGTNEYLDHKKKRFRTADEMEIKNNEAFLLLDENTRKLYATEFEKKSAIYFGEQPKFLDILERIKKYIHKL
ncbi:MAG: nucleotidyl transferase AbiEii/AbiGii toxin family protein [Coxiellaceae bacterium]|nr:nucleotidyl transferase AbiEii/AbiGii toxin family protein [Coxiellaceae bacterium]